MARWLSVVLTMILAALVPGGGAHAQTGAPETFATYGMPKDAVWGPVIEAFKLNMNEFVQRWASDVAP